jgi:hypothetical protein
MLTKVLLASVLSLAMVFAGHSGKTQPTSGSEAGVAEPGGSVASCCAPSVVQSGDKADCCKSNLACCDKGKTKACCVATSKIGCCAKGMKCCETNSACCSSVQECCREGSACCNEGKACCGKASAATEN